MKVFLLAAGAFGAAIWFVERLLDAISRYVNPHRPPDAVRRRWRPHQQRRRSLATHGDRMRAALPIAVRTGRPRASHGRRR